MTCNVPGPGPGVIVWDTPAKMTASAWERVRLVPYWTGRAARQIGSLAGEAEIASYAFERIDGSGYFREAKTGAFPSKAVSSRRPRRWRHCEPRALGLMPSRKKPPRQC